MRTYRRARICGGTYFFTVNLAQRHEHDLLIRRVGALRESFHAVRQTHPFVVIAIVILPDHLHCVWRLPPEDDDYPTRWRLIKAGFSRLIEPGERVSDSRRRKGERGIWQRRYWEHAIRDDLDLQRHLDYIHYNPVKHGYVSRAIDWPYSSLHRYVARGVYPANWAAGQEVQDMEMDE